TNRTSGETSAGANGHRTAGRIDADASREKQIDQLRRSRREHPGIFEKEGTFLGEEEREPREVRALLVDLHLREVRVVGEIERQTRRHPELGVCAKLRRSVRASLGREYSVRAA